MYLEIDDGFLEHPKTLRFCRAVRDPCAATYLLRLWTWATKSAADGDLRDMEPDELELILRWPGEPGACYGALVSAGFIDKDEDGATIHNWAERTGGAIVRMEQGGVKRRESATERKRLQRQRERERKAAEAKAGGHALVTRDTSVTSRPVTPLDKARPDEARPGQPAQSDARAGDPTTPGPVALAQQCALVVQEAAALTPSGPRPLTAWELTQLFGRIRSDVLKTSMGWRTPTGQASAKADTFLRQLQGDPDALADIAPTIELYFEKARGSPNAKECDVGFAFGAWLHRFQDLREELRGERRPAQQLGPRDAAFLRSVLGDNAC